MPPRTPAPICGSNLAGNYIDNGTLKLGRSIPPTHVDGSMCVSAQSTIVLPTDLPHRLLLAAQCGLPLMRTEVRVKLQELLTIQNFLLLSGFLAADFAFAGTGIGTFVNIVIGGVTVVALGGDAIKGFSHLRAFYSLAKDAKTDAEFKKSGAEFAKGITNLSLDTLMLALLRKDFNNRFANLMAKTSDATLESAWFAYVDSIKFEVPYSRGVIWAGLGETGVVRAKEFARIMSLAASNRSLAQAQAEFRVINQILEESGFMERYLREFGNTQTELTYRIWERASMRYVESLEGQVTAYVDFSKVRYDKGILEAGRGAGPAWKLPNGKEINSSVILTEIEDIIDRNPKVTSIKVIDAKTGKEYFYQRMVGNAGLRGSGN